MANASDDFRDHLGIIQTDEPIVCKNPLYYFIWLLEGIYYKFKEIIKQIKEVKMQECDFEKDQIKYLKELEEIEKEVKDETGR